MEPVRIHLPAGMKRHLVAPHLSYFMTVATYGVTQREHFLKLLSGITEHSTRVETAAVIGYEFSGTIPVIKRHDSRVPH